MNKHVFAIPSTLSVLALLLVSCVPVKAQPTKIEAEANLAAGDLQVIDLPDASGGQAVSLPRDWNPLFIAPPPQEGAEFTIWVRYKDKPILLKASTKEGQKDLGWQWDSPANFTWKRAGRWKRDEIGDNLIIIRGGDGGQGPVLDAVIFSTDDAYNPGNDPKEKVAAPKATAGDDAAKQANLNEGAAVALGIKDAPDGQLFEAENFSAGSVTDVPGASGGQGVKSDNNWQPLVNVPLPAGEAFKVWVRHKGGPFCIKTTGGDRWFWNTPDHFEWRETDVFSRDELRGTLTVGRGDGGTQANTPLIDCVVLQKAVKQTLPPDKPNPALPAQKVAASINWGQSIGSIPPLAWGINEHEVMTDDGATPQFQKLLGALKTPLIRVHNGGSGDAWTNEKTRDWDVDKIKSGFAKSTGYGDAKLMINIAKWPSWLSHSDTLEADKEDEFAALMGRLVKVFRDDLKQPVAYWEITNELDNNYEKAGKLDDLWRLYNKCAAAMRKQDPKAKLGGPALTWAKGTWVEGFLKNCPDVQFISWHNYATGDLYEPNESVFEKASTNLGGNAKGAMALVKQYDKGRHLETFLTEYNVKYTWDPYERRHQNTVGAVFDALAVKQISELGLSGATLWQQRGQAYGTLIDNADKTFPAYHLYTWGPQFLSGKTAQVTSGDEKLLELLAVSRQDGKKSVLIINKADHELILPSAKSLLPNCRLAQQLNTETFLDSLDLTASETKVPGYSLTLLAQ